MKLFFVWCVSPKRETEGVAIFWPNYHTWASSGLPHPSPSAPSLVIFLISPFFDDTALLAGRIEYQLGRLTAAVGHLQVKP